MIREELAGKRVLLTGATGFLGSALLERLVVDVPVARIDVLVRGDPRERIASLGWGSVFSAARSRLGGRLDELFGEKVRALSGDLAQRLEITPDVDLVVHCAATVSFDAPIDEAFRTNLQGTVALYEAARPRPFVHVSTAYVAAVIEGEAREELPPRLDWRAEAEAARGVAAEIDRESRRPEALEEIAARARSEIGKAGRSSVARRGEEIRREWIRERLVRAGRARARSLGWQDAYTLTKALAEMALEELAGSSPLAIVRPSIIESALARPYPGWIDGFRMADPVMLAYGRGLLPDFPGHPDALIDIVPVDHVVNAILAVAARMPQAGGVLHVCTGKRNPLRFYDLYEETRRFFLAHPLPERNRGAYRVPSWRFPGRAGVERRLRASDRAIELAERLVELLPRSRFARDVAEPLGRQRRRVNLLKRYAELYGPYAETATVFDDERSQSLLASLPDEDRRDFGFDPTSFTWSRYLGEIHLPALTAPLRWPAPPRESRAPALRAGSDGRRVLAAFDLEGTLVDANVVESYAWLRLAESRSATEGLAVLGSLLARAPRLLRQERADRGAFLRSFYRHYAGAPASLVRKLASDVLGDVLLARLSPAAVRRIREHRRAGHTIVFVTGSLDFLVRPLAPLADVIAGAQLEERNGRFTGRLAEAPLVGDARGSWLRRYGASVGADLERCFAYADSLSDLPMLEAVGHPVAVNPDVRLARVARERRWPVEEWPREGESLLEAVLRPLLA